MDDRLPITHAWVRHVLETAHIDLNSIIAGYHREFVHTVELGIINLIVTEDDIPEVFAFSNADELQTNDSILRRIAGMRVAWDLLLDSAKYNECDADCAFLTHRQRMYEMLRVGYFTKCKHIPDLGLFTNADEIRDTLTALIAEIRQFGDHMHMEYWHVLGRVIAHEARQVMVVPHALGAMPWPQHARECDGSYTCASV
jgi:hypothetical protein